MYSDMEYVFPSMETFKTKKGAAFATPHLSGLKGFG